MGADAAQAEVRRVKEDLESEKRRTKELQEQLDKANLKIRQIEGSHLYLKPLLQTIHQNLKIVKQSQAGLVKRFERCTQHLVPPLLFCSNQPQCPPQEKMIQLTIREIAFTRENAFGTLKAFFS